MNLRQNFLAVVLPGLVSALSPHAAQAANGKALADLARAIHRMSDACEQRAQRRCNLLAPATSAPSAPAIAARSDQRDDDAEARPHSVARDDARTAAEAAEAAEAADGAASRPGAPDQPRWEPGRPPHQDSLHR